jgi:hypothetical protein
MGDIADDPFIFGQASWVDDPCGFPAKHTTGKPYLKKRVEIALFQSACQIVFVFDNGEG